MATACHCFDVLLSCWIAVCCFIWSSIFTDVFTVAHMRSWLFFANFGLCHALLECAWKHTCFWTTGECATVKTFHLHHLFIFRDAPHWRPVYVLRMVIVSLGIGTVYCFTKYSRACTKTLTSHIHSELTIIPIVSFCTCKVSRAWESKSKHFIVLGGTEQSLVWVEYVETSRLFWLMALWEAGLFGIPFCYTFIIFHW